MREDFFLYFEETEWCLRAKKQGFEVVVNPNAISYHKSSEKTKKYHYYMTRNRLLLAKTEPEYYSQTLKALVKPIKEKIKSSIINFIWY
ncbi:glycosyltransferase family 2 protein [Thalassobellus suaedae]|uniref:Uncharacterized protein n=1 Tax=Thalassobellus suaedae TaxID=3074124 RepID=A0ABY9XUJ0_9FLAO|nr:hypothetical protein RHP51_02560 [Flavobacteriaceae bacterium HL-DH14]